MLPSFFKKFDELLGDTKFICGDTVTQYDFQVAGLITNSAFYNCEMIPVGAMKKCLGEHASYKVKTYITDFKDAM